MFVRGKTENLNDFFKTAESRTEKCVYFYRINGYNSTVDKFLRDYYQAAKKCGVVIEGNIPNPTEQNLNYYNEMMGMEYRKDKAFIENSLKSWLKRINSYQTDALSEAICKVMDKLAADGKNENMQKNAYIKFMCWLYYKFEQVVSKLGESTVPKILYEASVSKYELMLLDVLCECGCDVVLLQHSGDADYLKYDPSSKLSNEYKTADMTAFPSDFCVKKIREDLRNASVQQQAPAQPSHTGSLSFSGTSDRQNNAVNPSITPQSNNVQPAPQRRGISFTGVSDKPATVSQPDPVPQSNVQPAPRQPSRVSFTGISDTPATVRNNSAVPHVNTTSDGGPVRTNVFIKKNFAEDIKTPVQQRGSESGVFFNCFFKVSGIEEKNTYTNELFRLKEDILAQKRCLLIIDKGITNPDVSEINSIRHQNYTSVENMIASLSVNISFPSDLPMQKLMVSAFASVIREEYGKSGNLNKEKGKAVYLLCWLKRYQSQLFKGRDKDGISCLICLGGCKNDNEAAFVRMIARMPADVLVLVPNLEDKCVLNDNSLCQISFDNSYALAEYPTSKANLRTSTAAADAKGHMDNLMYQSTGMYRRNQYKKAIARVLETTYDEIAILWDKELKFRPNFDTDKAEADIPVIFAKISGVPNKELNNYWLSIKNLMTDNTLVVKNPSFVNKNQENPMKKSAPSFLKNGQLQREAIMSHSNYRYGHLREEMQHHILDKIQMLIDSKLISGTFRNGMEYTIVAEALNLDKGLLRQIQDFDFTRKNPKVIYINTTETQIPVEDSIVMALLNLIGFDVLFFVPTGYRSVESNYTFTPFCEHQIGDYEYDLGIPDFNMLKRSLKDMIFGRGF